MKRPVRILLIFGCLLLVSGVAVTAFALTHRPPEKRYAALQGSEFYTGSSSGVLIDVRTEEEFETGHAAGAINVPVSDIEKLIDVYEKDTPLYIYCKRGTRSRQACEKLTAYGFTHLYNLDGGTDEYPPPEK